MKKAIQILTILVDVVIISDAAKDLYKRFKKRL